MSTNNLTAKIYTDWGYPLRIFTGSVVQETDEIPFYVSVKDFSKNVGSSTITKWGSALMPCPGLIHINNNILTNKQEPHYRCTAIPFTELRKLTNNTDMHPGNKDRANAIIKWLEPIYREYAEKIVKPIETGVKALEPIEITVAGISDDEQKKVEYRKLRESGMTASEALTEVLGKPNQRQRDACESIVPVSVAQDVNLSPHKQDQLVYSPGSPIELLGFTVDDVAKRLYELKQENENLKSEVEKLRKDIENYKTIRDMFLSIGGD